MQGRLTALAISFPALNGGFCRATDHVSDLRQRHCGHWIASLNQGTAPLLNTYAHIPKRHAARFNTFCVEYLNPFLNFHRPCPFEELC